jgi:hypothetical protein
MSAVLSIPVDAPADGVESGGAAGAAPDEPFRSLDDQLLALIRGDLFECPACGEGVDASEEGRIACAECGSSLEPPPPHIEGQLMLM